jgi:Rad3-related DNA helicase
VDFTFAPLAGVIVVGAGVPPPDPLRRAIAQHFDGTGIDGREVAFVQPAMTRVLQVAGRLLRSPEDAGVLCLVDPRFREPAFQRFFPDHWQPRPVAHDRAAAEVAKFWRARILSPAPEHPGAEHTHS